MYNQTADASAHRSNRSRGSKPRHDVVIVGARAAGASTAMLMARAGLDVLVVDRASVGSDTLSSHALMSGGVDHLRRWGVLDRIAEVTPPIHETKFEFGDQALVAEHPDDPLFAPRRTILDPMLVDSAQEAGAQFRFGARAVELISDDQGRIAGIIVESGDGHRESVAANLVVGADGLRSFVARHVEAPVSQRSTNYLASIYAYVRGADLASDQYRFSYRDGWVGGAIPTNDDLHCVFVSMSPQAFLGGVQVDVGAALQHTLARVSPELGAAVRAGTIAGPIRSFPGHPGQFRVPHGPGWALVGDAGYFKDPAAAHGLSDAFRDAELLTEAVLADDMYQYEQVRNTLSMPLFEQIDHLAALRWSNTDARGILRDFGKSMAAEARALELRRRCVAETPATMASPERGAAAPVRTACANA